jgi:type IV pilus assembly protein PilX
MNQLNSPKRQSGVVLAVSLILLLLLTILAIAASSSSSLQERMASNAQESNVAFQASETALANLNSQLRRGVVPPADALQELVYPTRTIRTRMQSASRFAEGSSLDAEAGSGTPQIIIYDFTSSSTLDPAATTAAQITNNNSNARHLQGYRDRIIQ